MWPFPYGGVPLWPPVLGEGGDVCIYSYVLDPRGSGLLFFMFIYKGAIWKMTQGGVVFYTYPPKGVHKIHLEYIPDT